MRVGVVGHPEYDRLPSVLAALADLAPKLGISLFLEKSIAGFVRGGQPLGAADQVDAMVTLGGDGTLLRGAKLVRGRRIPILGVNLGRLGFLTTCGGNEAETALRRLAGGDFLTDERMALGARVVGQRGDDHEWLALNDMVLHKGGFARVIAITVAIDGEPLGSYAADGIVVATPTGSTAYSLSAGGPIIEPDIESIILTPISAHALAVRPLVISADAEVTVRVDDGPEEILLTVDGQGGTDVRRDEQVVIKRAKDPFLIVRFPGDSFFGRIREKLGWGGIRERDDRG